MQNLTLKDAVVRDYVRHLVEKYHAASAVLSSGDDQVELTQQVTPAIVMTKSRGGGVRDEFETQRYHTDLNIEQPQGCFWKTSGRRKVFGSLGCPLCRISSCGV